MLDLPDKFKLALGSGVRTSLFPLVVIRKGTLLKSHIRLSIKSISIEEYGILGWDPIYGDYTGSYAPLLLSSPSIKSSADIINNKYTISSVSLSVSNAMYNGKIFSDNVNDLLNEKVEIYYCANGITSLDDCLLVYTGKLRRYSQSAETIKLTLEDLTEEKLTTKIPATTIEDKSRYNEDDIGKPYPMVYGKVSKSPLIFSENRLEIDKPSQPIESYWNDENQVEYGNSYVDSNHPLRQKKWLQPYFYLSVYNEGFLPIPEKVVKNWGSWEHPNISVDDKIYEYEDASSGSSAAIVLEKDVLAYEEYTLDTDGNYIGVGEQGIPSRVYRPIVDVGFFALNSDKYRAGYDDNSNSQWMANSSNKFFAFDGYPEASGGTDSYNDTEVFDNVTYVTEHNTDVYPSGIDNTWSPMQDRYDVSWGNNGDKKWWQPTALNESAGTTVDGGIWGYEDENWDEGNRKFPVDYIQNNQRSMGLHLDAKNNLLVDCGSFATLRIARNIGDYQCITKILYNIEFFIDHEVLHPHEYLDTDYQHRFYSGWAPCSFWLGRNLPNDDHEAGNNDNVDEISEERNRWDINRGLEEWATPCEVPNHQHWFKKDREQYDDDGNPNGWSVRPNNEDEGHDFPLEGNNFDNVIVGFDSTNAYDSIQWGVTNSRWSSRAFGTTHTNLKEVYILQDYIIKGIEKQKFHSDIQGRTLSNTLMMNPSSILKHILEKELDYGLYSDSEILDTSDTLDTDWEFSFTLSEQKEAKSVFEGLFKSSLFIPSFDSVGNFKFINLKQTISSSDISGYPIINNQDILKYSFELSKLDDVYSSVNVKYKKNYASGEFDKYTGYSIIDSAGASYDSYNDLTEHYYSDQNEIYDVDSYYNTSPEDTKLEVETEYIRDEATAINLQKRLLMWHINQHLITKIDLPVSYMHLEAGDYIRFEELVGGKLAFGYDYTQVERRNGQLIYPVFFITKVSKSLTKVSIEAIQIHRGEYGFPADDDNDDGDIVNSEEVDVTDWWEFPNTYPQKEIYEGVEDDYLDLYLNHGTLNNGEIVASVMTNMDEGWEYYLWVKKINSPDGSISYYDERGELQTINNGEYEAGDFSANDLVFHDLYMRDGVNSGNISITKKFALAPFGATIEFMVQVKNINKEDKKDFKQFAEADAQVALGDVNRDGIINILDLMLLVSMILNYEYDEVADMNGSGTLNIQDVLMMINIILGD